MYAFEVVNLLSKEVISAYVQGESRIFLKFNILSLHYLRHYWLESDACLFQTALGNTRSSIYAIREGNLGTCFLRFNHIALFQSHCSIHGAIA